MCKNVLEPREQNLCRKMHKNRPQLLVAGPLILHDNARPHIADVVTKKLRDYGWDVLPHASYSPDTSPPDFDLFPNLKEPMFPTDGTWAIGHMNKSCVLDGIIMLPKRRDSVIEKQGDYIEELWTDNLFVCSNANPLHYYMLRVPRKADRLR